LETVITGFGPRGELPSPLPPLLLPPRSLLACALGGLHARPCAPLRGAPARPPRAPPGGSPARPPDAPSRGPRRAPRGPRRRGSPALGGAPRAPGGALARPPSARPARPLWHAPRGPWRTCARPARLPARFLVPLAAAPGSSSRARPRVAWRLARPRAPARPGGSPHASMPRRGLACPRRAQRVPVRAAPARVAIEPRFN
jgi:hypothetical protein